MVAEQKSNRSDVSVLSVNYHWLYRAGRRFLFFLCCAVGSVCHLPHLLFGLLEALRHKVNLLEGGDETLLVASRLWVEHLHAGLI